MTWMDACVDVPLSKAEIRRVKLVDAARKLFIANGFHATGMAQIAKESGIAVGQIYRDFASKEDIVAALVEADCARVLEFDELDTAIVAGDRERVRAWLHGFIEPEDSLEDARLFAEIVAESSRNHRIAAIFTNMLDGLRMRLKGSLALLAPGDKTAAERELMSDTLTTLSIGLLHYRLLRPDLQVKPLISALHDLIDREVDRLAALTEQG
ncbi:transcriptional regulator, TetR family [Sphingomonas guangdongensis]|uniref:Transcriptional regulator, TetR family n=1 Tax=Sphingomonas guangdongensis TaxID=1141890 RepID=A0A285QZL8_9SPHN|nr:TetR/AcrR family transcriptional regulator [Sphingomonas guangdongensis]SOB87301.1 transcriptional regulator, TetR family [Sphingomonas guangdongensis]